MNSSVPEPLAIFRFRLLRCVVSAAVLMFAISSPAATFKWVEATPAELAMTSYPKAPGAPAIVLSYEEADDASTAEMMVHVRIKILSEGGLKAANINLPDLHFSISPFTDQELYARTIHPNGSIVPFTGKPYQATDSVGPGDKIISLPDVTVGSILEYGFHFRGLNAVNTFDYRLSRGFAPRWTVQQAYFLCSGHFRLDTSDIDASTVHWVTNLPAGAEIKRVKNQFELNVADVAALSDEEFMPPPSSVRYRASFFYWAGTWDDYWAKTGDRADNDWKDFYKTTKLISESVGHLIAPTDTDEQKLHKLYDAVMAFENTDLTRERSKQEEKGNNLKEAKKSEDIWQRKRGSSEELTLLYIALARAAGYQAFPMAVTSRTVGVFNRDVLNWSQMDDVIAVVVVNGHEVFLDPGSRECAFGYLAPWHSNVGGVTFEGKQLKFQNTPIQPSVGSQTQRIADIKLDTAGNVEGTVTITWARNAALSQRRLLRREDQQAVESAIKNSVQNQVPAGVQLRLAELKGLDNYNTPLIATFNVSGRLGSLTGKRLIVPAEFFASTAKPILAAQSRILDINFPEAYFTQDAMRITLPSSMTVEALPEAKILEQAKDLGYEVKPSTADGKVLIQRAAYLNRIAFKAQEFDALHKFFAEVATHDQDTLVLRAIPQ